MAAYVWPVDNWQTTDGTKYTGRRLRQLLGALTSGKTAARPLGARSGVMVGTPTSTVTATSTVCTVQPHSGVIDAQTIGIAGPYFYAIDAAVTKSVPAADASQARVDLVAVQISDPAESDGTATPGVDVVYVPGTPGAGVPASPARSLPLATVNVPALNGGAPTVVWLAPLTVASGGIVPTASAGEYPQSPYVGQYLDDAALGLLRWDGAKWTTAHKPPAWVPITPAAGIAANTFGYPPAFRVWTAQGRVELRGGLRATAGTFTGGGADALFTLPAVARPAQQIESACVTNYSSGVTANTRVEVTVPGLVNLFSATGQISWVSLDGISYYLT